MAEHIAGLPRGVSQGGRLGSKRCWNGYAEVNFVSRGLVFPQRAPSPSFDGVSPSPPTKRDGSAPESGSERPTPALKPYNANEGFVSYALVDAPIRLRRGGHHLTLRRLSTVGNFYLSRKCVPLAQQRRGLLICLLLLLHRQHQPRLQPRQFHSGRVGLG